MKEVMEETSELIDDDESPWHEKSEDEMRLALDMNATAFSSRSWVCYSLTAMRLWFP